MSQPHWVCLRSRCVCFPCLHCLGCRLLCQELSEASPGFCALPRSKPFRFRYSSEAQTWLGQRFVPFPSASSSGDQVFGEHSCYDSSPPPSLPLGFLDVQPVCLLRCAMCLFLGADLWLRPSQWMSTIQNPKKSWLATKPACSLVEDASLGPQLPPSGSGCPHLPISVGGWAGPQPVSSAQSFVL